MELRQKIKICSPAHFDTAKKTGTCYTTSNLKDIAQVYNNQHSKDVIDTDKIVKKKELHRVIASKFKTQCGEDETCWLDKLYIDSNMKERLLEAFRHKKPTAWYKNIRMWLNSHDIQNVMSQYHKRYDDFVFLGVYPIDFESKSSSGGCVTGRMCTFNLKTDVLDKGKQRFGLIVNTDPHYRGGQHWFAIYCNLNPRKNNFGIYLYDSTATKNFVVPKEMKIFMKHVKEQVQATLPPKDAAKFVIAHNTIKSQSKNTECGIFSIVFLTQCLKNIPFQKICEKMYNDDMMVKFRDYFFRP